MWLSLFRFSIFSAFTTFGIGWRPFRKQWMCVCVKESELGVRQGGETTKLPSVNANFVVRTFEMSETHVFEHYIYHHNINVNKSEAKSKSRRRQRRLKTLTSINLNLLFNFLATKVHSHTKHPQAHTRTAMSGWFSCSKKAKVYLSRLFMWYCDSDYYCSATITECVCECVIGRAVFWVRFVPFECWFRTFGIIAVENSSRIAFGSEELSVRSWQCVQ